MLARGHHAGFLIVWLRVYLPPSRFVILYGFNTIGSNFSLIIPINFITLTLITFLGFPALFSLVLLLVIAFWGENYVRDV